MLKKGDVISYGTTGVCKVEGECEQTVKGQKKRYIVLKPVHQINSTLYVPVDNDELKTKFKPLLTGDEKCPRRVPFGKKAAASVPSFIHRYLKVVTESDLRSL